MVERRSISVLGATGSVGRSALDVILDHGGDGAYDIRVLTGGSNAVLLAEQARKVGAGMAVIRDEAKLADLREALAGTGIAAAAGEGALLDAAAEPVDLCLSAIAGAAGLAPTLAAVRGGAVLALANKESLVCAGPLLRRAVAEAGTRILPVDSEHSAIFQVLEEKQAHAIDRIVLTASGGPFRDFPLERMRAVTPEQALDHPNWSMGAGISLDSATMFNKGLELIEADQLFPVPGERIEILVHPQSIIHSMVGYDDGSVLAQLGNPDMRTPIAYALGWPRRVSSPVGRLDFVALSRLDFEAPDATRFPALRIARAAMEAGGLAPCAMNAAKEVAARAFLERRIPFLEIAAVVEDVLQGFDPAAAASLDDVMAADRHARALAADAMRRRARRSA